MVEMVRSNREFEGWRCKSSGKFDRKQTIFEFWQKFQKPSLQKDSELPARSMSPAIALLLLNKGSLPLIHSLRFRHKWHSFIGFQYKLQKRNIHINVGNIPRNPDAAS